METIGIIAEYNPFHNGHLYHINKIKEKYQDSTIILVMTGNYTERGDVAIIDKWKRTEIALKYGIDLVIELPYPFATQSADYFSYGGISLLEKLKVDRVIFGSESDNIEDLQIIAKTQLNNEEFDKLVKVGIEKDKREWLWRLAFNYERSNLNFDSIVDYFITKKDGYYLVELICAVDKCLDIDRIIDKINDKDLIEDLKNRKNVISSHISNEQFNRLINKLNK